MGKAVQWPTAPLQIAAPVIERKPDKLTPPKPPQTPLQLWLVTFSSRIFENKIKSKSFKSRKAISIRFLAEKVAQDAAQPSREAAFGPPAKGPDVLPVLRLRGHHGRHALAVLPHLQRVQEGQRQRHEGFRFRARNYLTIGDNF